ncbi:uncharacterized protein yc1106_01449 [Curvularia clavata]|uniref:Transcription factor domain-containing protein n=1 Tax=Curvularia clavata TaxID=95742 RepID=A0A9Q8Z1X5_CURCL|nr:uncharacterized protein yc1106_01449 [Curvularia clavata]
MSHLSQRLEQLEKHVSGTGDDSSSSKSLPTPAGEAMPRHTPVASPEAPLIEADGQESWIYQLATDTRRSFQNQATPVDTPAPSINSAMLSLNEALEDLGRIRVRNTALDFELSPAESRACIDRFNNLMHAMVVPDAFLSAMIDMNVLRALPDVINSPYVNIDPGMRVLYYNAIYYGLRESDGPGGDLTTKAYMKMLENVPAWLESSTETILDAQTAALSSWTSTTMHDYQLSWKFHCKLSRYLISKGKDQVDSTPAKTFAEEDERDAQRYLYWHALCIDLSFRLFYGKPRVIRWAPGKVRPPLMFRHDNMHPSAMSITIAVVWVRYTLLVEEVISYIDNHACHGQVDDLSQKADECCIQLEKLLAEWRFEQLMNDQDVPNEHRYIIADHIMNIYTYIIGIQRLVQTAARSHSATTVKPSPFAVRAARKVSNMILDFHKDTTMNAKSRSITDHFISLYPFCVVFTLYEHILASYNPEDCEGDIQTLESIGVAVNKACAQRRDMIPFAKTIDALNRVSRTLQDERRKEMTPSLTNRVGYTGTQGLNLMPTSFDTVQNLVATELPDFDMSNFSVPTYLPDTESDFQSLGLFRALENEFVARNWQGNWWDLSGSVDERVGQTPESGMPQAASLAYTPSGPENMM